MVEFLIDMSFFFLPFWVLFSLDATIKEEPDVELPDDSDDEDDDDDDADDDDDDEDKK